MKHSIYLKLLVAAISATACAGSPQSPTPSQPWIEETVTFTFGSDEQKVFKPASRF